MRRKHILLIVAMILLCVGAFLLYKAYTIVREPNVQKDFILYISSGSGFAQVMDSLETNDVLIATTGIDLIAEKKNYIHKVKPGRYQLKEGMSNEDWIDLLRSGEQLPVRVTFNNIRRMPALASQISKKLEVSDQQVLKVLQDSAIMADLGYTEETFPAAFVPDTYEVWWDTDAEVLVRKLVRESKRFWTRKRKKKARDWGLDQVEIATIASIVREETLVMEDAPRIAGVYLNRVRISMPLQADPTIKFALNADTIQRILDKDKLIDSPYNTYMYYGLPPGPINIPEPEYIDAVLNGERHKYLYFCADADLSGRSVFARTYGEHLRNARKYQAALDQMRIYR